MSAYTANASLIIHPDDPHWHFDEPEIIVTNLRKLGLVANEIQNEEQSYFIGDNFLELISFLGCSPNINLTPQDNPGKFCFVRLISNPKITALTSKHSHAPHCPHCKKPEKNWSDNMSAIELTCSSCGRIAPPWHYNWRKSAGFGRFFIEITEIYPREAIPQAALLTTLEQLHNTTWSYFYLYS